MRAEVIGVGTELLLGDIVNTNAAHIGSVLAQWGIDCFAHHVVGDNTERIAEMIASSLARADAVVLTGGLGPTQDDVTREAIALVTGRPLERDPAIEEALRARFAALGREMPSMNLRQAEVPAGATVIPQTFGTAPGLIVEHSDGVIYAIPGVPAEMEDMLARAVVPDLRRRSGHAERIVSRIVRTSGLPESTVAEALAPLWDELGGALTMAFLAGGGEVRIRLTAKAADDASATATLDEAEARVRALLGAAVVGTGDERLEVAVGDLLRARGWTIACAESLTAGWLAGRIAQVPGAGDYLRGGIVAYAPDLKRSALGVPDEVLASHGSVNEPVARAMAAGVRARLGADVGVAITGVAGPDPQGREPGTVIIAVDGPLGQTAREVRLPGDRNTVRALAAAVALNLVRLYLLEVAT